MSVTKSAAAATSAAAAAAAAAATAEAAVSTPAAGQGSTPMLSVAEATTGLFAACKLGRRGLAAACIKLHASLNATDKYGMSPLHYACLYGHASLVQLLLVRGAADYYKEMIDPDKAAEMGQAVATRVINSPLHWAVLRGHLRCIWLLLQAGYSAQDLDQCGNNCLHLAASCTVPSRSLQLQIIRTIMYAGFDPDARNWYGQRAVDLLPADAHEARRLLVSAQECTRCATTGTPFGAEELRYLCHCTGAFFSEEASTSVSVRAVAEPDVLITAKGVAKRVPVMMPVRMGQELVYKVADAEAALDLALQPFAFTLPADADAAGDGRGGATDALAPGGARSFGGGGAGSEGGDDMSDRVSEAESANGGDSEGDDAGGAAAAPGKLGSGEASRTLGGTAKPTVVSPASGLGESARALISPHRRPAPMGMGRAIVDAIVEENEEEEEEDSEEEPQTGIITSRGSTAKGGPGRGIGSAGGLGGGLAPGTASASALDDVEDEDDDGLADVEEEDDEEAATAARMRHGNAAQREPELYLTKSQLGTIQSAAAVVIAMKGDVGLLARHHRFLQRVVAARDIVAAVAEVNSARPLASRAAAAHITNAIAQGVAVHLAPTLLEEGRTAVELAATETELAAALNVASTIAVARHAHDADIARLASALQRSRELNAHAHELMTAHTVPVGEQSTRPPAGSVSSAPSLSDAAHGAADAAAGVGADAGAGVPHVDTGATSAGSVTAVGGGTPPVVRNPALCPQLVAVRADLLESATTLLQRLQCEVQVTDAVAATESAAVAVKRAVELHAGEDPSLLPVPELTPDEAAAIAAALAAHAAVLAAPPPKPAKAPPKGAPPAPVVPPVPVFPELRMPLDMNGVPLPETPQLDAITKLQRAVAELAAVLGSARTSGADAACIAVAEATHKTAAAEASASLSSEKERVLLARVERAKLEKKGKKKAPAKK